MTHSHTYTQLLLVYKRKWKDEKKGTIACDLDCPKYEGNWLNNELCDCTAKQTDFIEIGWHKWYLKKTHDSKPNSAKQIEVWCVRVQCASKSNDINQEKIKFISVVPAIVELDIFQRLVFFRRNHISNNPWHILLIR